MTLRLPSDRHTPALARRALDVVKDRVSSGTLDAARLLTSELVTNAVRHAGLAQRDAVGLRIACGRGLRVEVTDAGTGFRWGRLGAADPMRGDGGLGFLLVARLAASWGVESGPPTRVWFELDAGRPFDRAPVRVSRPARVTVLATTREGRMDEKRDETKGRIKEATGALTGDDDLKREGKMDRAGATVKEKTNEAVDRTKEAVSDLTRDR